MSRVSLADLISAQTADTIINTFIDGLVLLGLKNAPSWKNGNTARSILRVFSTMGSGFSGNAANISASGFRDLALGSWKTLWARSNFNIERPTATFAEGDLTFTNSGSNSFSFTAGEVQCQNSTSNATYVNTASLVLGPGPSSVTVAFQAIAQGSASSSSPGGIDTVNTTMLGVSVTNEEALVGLDDASDDDLDALCLAKLGSWSPNGPPNVYMFVSIADPTTIPVLVNLGLTTQTSVPITRAVPFSDGNMGVNVYLASADGPATDGDVVIVNARLQAAARPFGIRVTALAAVPITINVAYDVWLKGSGLTTAGAEAILGTALANYFETIPLGGDILPPSVVGAVDPNSIEGILFESTQGMKKAAVSTPSDPVTLSPDQVAVLGTVTPTVHLL